jgi:exonuclease III
MMRSGKLENIKREMRRNRLDILGLSEVRWKEGGDFESEEFRVCYAGGKESQRGVAIVLDKEMAKRVLKVDMVSDRIISVKIQADPVDLVIFQVYMPTSAHEDDEVDEIYNRIEELVAKEKGKDYVVIMGDWNAVVGEGREGKEIGEHGLGSRNERGEKLVDFVNETNLW